MTINWSQCRSSWGALGGADLIALQCSDWPALTGSSPEPQAEATVSLSWTTSKVSRTPHSGLPGQLPGSLPITRCLLGTAWDRLLWEVRCSCGFDGVECSQPTVDTPSKEPPRGSEDKENILFMGLPTTRTSWAVSEILGVSQRLFYSALGVCVKLWNAFWTTEIL